MARAKGNERKTTVSIYQCGGHGVLLVSLQYIYEFSTFVYKKNYNNLHPFFTPLDNR